MSQEEKERKTAKPRLTEQTVENAVKDLFQIKAIKTNQLDSYDDANFYIRDEQQNEHVFKIYNGFDSRNHQLIDAVVSLLDYLTQNGFAVPKPKQANNGKLWATIEAEKEDSTKISHVVLLVKWIPGSLVCDSQSLTPNLYRRMGYYLATLRKSLDNFDHEGFHRVHQWDLQQFLGLETFLSHFDQEGEKVQLVQRVMNEYKSKVVPIKDVLRKGVLQNDFNDSNIILDDKNEEVRGVIDFGDAVYSWRIADLAIALAYSIVTLVTKPEKASGFVNNAPIEAALCFYNGFTNEYQLEENEKSVIGLLCCARLCNSAIVGSYSAMMDPSNLYLNKHSQPAWIALKLAIETFLAPEYKFN